jgi:hypothetical protein
MSNRKAASDFILKYIDKLLPGSQNRARYEALFAGMSDKQFDDFMKQIESGEVQLSIMAPNLDKTRLNLQRNLKISDELGHNFFQKLKLTDPTTGMTYLTPIKYMVVDLPVRRQVQLLQKKVTIPENNKHVDEMSGQSTGSSKGSKISFPELQVLFAQNLDSTITELIKFRGGDTDGFNAMNRAIYETGGVSIENLSKAGTKVKSVTTLSTLLKAMHLDNTLDK